MPSRQNYGMFVHATTRQDRNHVFLQWSDSCSIKETFDWQLTNCRSWRL